MVGGPGRRLVALPPPLLLLLLGAVGGYNVDVTVPVIKYAPRSASYFGFAVAQHAVWQRHDNRSVPV